VEDPPDDPVAAIAEVSPELAAGVTRASEGWSIELKLALIMALHALFTADYSRTSDLVQAIGRLLKYALENGSPPPTL
jgi:hypothetical protein